MPFGPRIRHTQTTGHARVCLRLSYHNLTQAILFHRIKTVIMPAKIQSNTICHQNLCCFLSARCSCFPSLRKNRMMPAGQYRNIRGYRLKHLSQPVLGFCADPTVRKHMIILTHSIGIQQKQACSQVRHNRTTRACRILAERSIPSECCICFLIGCPVKRAVHVMIPRNRIDPDPGLGSKGVQTVCYQCMLCRFPIVCMIAQDKHCITFFRCIPDCLKYRHHILRVLCHMQIRNDQDGFRPGMHTDQKHEQAPYPSHTPQESSPPVFCSHALYIFSFLLSFLTCLDFS